VTAEEVGRQEEKLNKNGLKLLQTIHYDYTSGYIRTVDAYIPTCPLIMNVGLNHGQERKR